MQLIRLTDGKKGTTLGKVYGYMLVLDKLYSKPIDGIPERMREKMHKIFMARWNYFHTPLMTAAYILEPEYIRRTFSRDEKIELFKVMKSVANDAHTLADLKKEYAQMKHHVDDPLHEQAHKNDHFHHFSSNSRKSPVSGRFHAKVSPERKQTGVFYVSNAFVCGLRSILRLKIGIFYHFFQELVK